MHGKKFVSKNQREFGNEITHTWGLIGKDCAISFGMLGDWLLKLHKKVVLIV